MEYTQNNSQAGLHDGTTDWGFDASQVPPEWHGWLHNMNDEAPSTLKGMDGKPVAYATPHEINKTGRAGTPVKDRYLPPFHRASPVYKGQAQEKVEAWVPPS